MVRILILALSLAACSADEIAAPTKAEGPTQSAIERFMMSENDNVFSCQVGEEHFTLWLSTENQGSWWGATEQDVSWYVPYREVVVIGTPLRSFSLQKIEIDESPGEHGFTRKFTAMDGVYGGMWQCQSSHYTTSYRDV